MPRPEISKSTRADDERVLAAIRLRCAGVSMPKIGARLGMTTNQVRKSTERVRDADAAESGEQVRGAYWS
jgi:hypothetical protein